MSKFEKAQIAYRKNNFLESAKLFAEAIDNDGLSLDDIIFSCEQVRKINRLLEKDENIDILFKLARAYFDSQNYEQAGQHFFELYQNNPKTYFLELSLQSSLLGGSIENAKRLAQRVLSSFHEKKRPDAIIEFLNQNNKILRSEEIHLWKIRSFIHSGQREELFKVFEEVKESPNFNYIVQDFVHLTENKGHYWNSHLGIQKVIIEALAEEKSFIIINKKRLVKLIMNYWMEENISHDVLTQTMNLAKKYNLAFIGKFLADYLGDDYLSIDFDQMIPSKLKEDAEVDFGHDLFKEEGEISEEDIIVRNIEVLKNLNDLQAIRDQLNKLKDINPDHPLLIKKEEDSTNNYGEPGLIYKNLMEELKSYTVSSNKEKQDAHLLNMASYYDQDYVQHNFEDMVVGLNLINLPKVALDVINMVEKKKLSEREKINLTYLKLETLFVLEEYFKVRDIVDDSINDSPLTENELLSFLYLRAESYYELKDYSGAWRAFKEIQQLKPKYRLTKQRLMEIEKYK